LYNRKIIMITLKIKRTDGSNQVMNMSEAVLRDEKGKKLGHEQFNMKIREIAHQVGGDSYESHKITFN